MTNVVPTALEKRVLAYLAKQPYGQASAGEVGAFLWGDGGRPRGRTASQGGGDYAAQMLLGRMRKRGLVHVAPSEGSSLWSCGR